MFDRILYYARDPRVLVPAATMAAVVVLAGGARFICGGWLVAAIVALVVVLVVLVALLLWVLFAQDREKRVERGTEEDEAVAARDERSRARSQLEALEERFRRALAEIRRSQRGPRGIYQNPWYLVLGETGSGKSSLVKNSGLELPAKFAGFVSNGPTENCEWWIMNEAVLLDTAGRYAEVLDTDGRKEWRRLLKLLRKARPKRALNGILLVVPVTTLLGRDEATLVEMAKELRRRLNEVTEFLGVDAPIYVMITKSDRIDGFLETARTLPPNRLGEALGWTNPERRVANFAEHVEDALRDVSRRIDEFLPELIMREADPVRRAKLILFPQAMREVARGARAFLGQLFQRAISEETPFLRGIYFVSSAQEGRTLSPLLEEMGHGWAHTASSHEGRPASLFVRDLFREVIIDPEEAGLSRRTSRLGPLGTRILLFTGAALALFTVVWLGTSLTLNLRSIARIKGETEGLLAVTPSIRMMSELRDRIDGEAASQGLFFHGAGLFSRTDRALDRARRSFVWSFEREYEQPTKDKLVSIVRQIDPSRSFAALADLALDVSWLETDLRSRQEPSAKAEPAEEAADEAAVRPPQLAGYAPISNNEVDQRQFQESYEAFVAWLPDIDVRTRIEREREMLGRVSGEILTIEQLETWAERNGKPVRYSDVDLPMPEEPGRGEVNPAYTRKTWETLVSGLIAGVERSGGASEQAVDRFQREYVTRYDDEWHRYMLETPTRPEPSKEVMKSPYLALLDQIDTNMEAHIRREENPAWLDLFEEVRRSDQEAPPPEDEKEEKPAGPPWPRYHAALEKVAEDVATVDMSSGEALDLAKRVAVGKNPNSFTDGLEVVRSIVPLRRDRRSAAKLQEILAMPIVDGYCAVLDSAMSELDQRWYEDIAANPRFGRDAGTTDLIALYGQGGELDRFRTTYLDPFLQNPDVDPMLDECRLPLGPELTDWLDSAGKMKEMLRGGFGGGVSRVPVRLVGAPSRVVGGSGVYVTRRELRINCVDKDHLFVYREGTGSYGFTWTPECTEVSLRVWVRRPGGQDRQLSSHLEWTGPMAMAQFLQSGRNPQDPSSDRLRWELDDFDDNARIIVEYRLRGGKEIMGMAHVAPPRSLRN